MPADMKETIAQSAMTLLTERHVKKLTVKDIVEECHITRQAFYYHFADIPEMFRWILEQQGQRVLLESRARAVGEEGLRSLFVMALEAMPYMRRAESSPYGRELQQLVAQSIQNVFEKAIEERGMYAQCSHMEVRLIVSYHEIGHALVAAKQSHSAPVQKITIIPRTSGALGYTMQVDTGEKNLLTKEELEKNSHPDRRSGGGRSGVRLCDHRRQQ